MERHQTQRNGGLKITIPGRITETVRSRRATENVAGVTVAPIPRGLWLLRAFLDL